MTPYLQIQDLEKSFGEVRVLEKLTLDLAEGEILALLGLSGSGKTTALRLLAGFETPDRGNILVDGVDVTALPPARRGFGMVFQHYALFPHMTVSDNVAFGLKAQGWKTEVIGGRIADVLTLVDLEGFGRRKVSEISGGQQQRVALARALAPEPRVLLLDEPLSNLDPALRERTRRELRAAVEKVGITTVLVTHEQEEAFYVGDRVAVLHQGHLQQVGAAEELYRAPTTRFVATFVGRASILPGTLGDTTDGEAQVRLDGGESDDGISWPGVAAEALETGDEVDFIAKPESLRFTPPDHALAIAGEVAERRFTGPLTYSVVRLASGEEVEVREDGESPPPGEQVFVAPRKGGPRPRIFRRGTGGP